MQLFTPIICTETGFWGGEYHFLAPSQKYAFKMLERRIAAGRIKKRPYGRR
jgi:hypothetical protein